MSRGIDLSETSEDFLIESTVYFQSDFKIKDRQFVNSGQENSLTASFSVVMRIFPPLSSNSLLIRFREGGG